MGLLLIPLVFFLAWLYDKHSANKSLKTSVEYEREQKERLGIKNE